MKSVATGKAHIVVCFAFHHSMGKSTKRQADRITDSFGGWLAREESDDAGAVRYYLIPISEGTLGGNESQPVNAVFEAFVAKKLHVEIFTNQPASGKYAGKVLGSVCPFSRGEGGELPAHAKPAALRRAKYREESKFIDHNAMLRRHKTQTDAMAILTSHETMNADELPIQSTLVNGNWLSPQGIVDTMSVYSDVDAELDRRAAIKASGRQQFDANRELATASSHGERTHTVHSALPIPDSVHGVNDYPLGSPQPVKDQLPAIAFAMPSVEFPANIWHVCI